MHSSPLKSLLLLSLLILSTLPQECHYSCHNCSASFYTNCFSCADPDLTLDILQDPDQIDPSFRHSIYKSGICTGKVPQGPNPLGVVLLIASVAGLLLTQSFQAFFIVSTLQTVSLFGLLEVAWVGAGSFILQSFQYFMPINLIVGPSKNDDANLFLFGFYRLDQYMISSEDAGLIAIFALDSVLFVAIILVFVFTFLRKGNNTKNQKSHNDQLEDKQAQQNINNLIPQDSHQSERFQQNDNPSQANHQIENNQPAQSTETTRGPFMEVLCNKIQQCFILRKFLHVLMYVFFFFVQQTVLSIMVGAVFQIGLLDIVIWGVYFIQVVTVLIIAFYEFQVDRKLNPKQKITHEFGLSLFLSRQCMFLVILKKIILPLGIVLPPAQQYIYFVMYLVLFLIQGTLDSRSKRTSCISRLGLWKLIEMLITTLILSFYFNEKKGTLSSTTNTINIILSLLLVVFILSLMVEFIVSFVGLFINSAKDNKIENEAVQKHNLIQLNNTEMTLNQDENRNQNIFEHVQLTRENTNENQEYISKGKELAKESPKIQEMRIQEIDNYQIQAIEPPRKQSELIVSQSKTHKMTPNTHHESSVEKDRNQKQMTEKSFSTKIDKSQSQDQHEKQPTPTFQPDIIQEDSPENDNEKTGQKDENVNLDKKKPRKQVMNAQLRKIYGMR